MVILKKNERSFTSFLTVSCKLALVAASPGTAPDMTLQSFSNVLDLSTYRIYEHLITTVDTNL